jgi:TolA-binding protein
VLLAFLQLPDIKGYLAVPDILGVHRIEITLCHRKIIDRIEEIGFPGPVIPHETIDLPAEIKLQLIIILEVDKGNTGEMHNDPVSALKIGKLGGFYRFFIRSKELHLRCFSQDFINLYKMAKKKQASDAGIGDVEGALTRTEQFIEDNQKWIVRIVTGILALVLLIIAVNRLYLNPLEEEAHAQMFVAEQYFEIDSFNLALYGDGNYSGFLQIIDDYGITRASNLANYYAGISFLKSGQYEDAIEYLKKFKSKDKMVAPIATGAIGDAYVELGDVEEGLSWYLKAAGQSDNVFTAPMFMMKAGLVYEDLEDYDKALVIYEKIQSDYPEYSRSNNIEKYITRSKLQS